MPDRTFPVARIPRDQQPMVSEGLSLAREAGRLLSERFRRRASVRLKGVADIVTTTDATVQRAMLARLCRRFPEHGILAEEGVDTRSGAEWVWILDPLDGTKNFAQGVPNFCVSIAAEWRGELQLGVVCDPIHDEVFLGVRGHGAWCNGRPIHVSRKTTLASAFVGTGCPHRIRQFAKSVGLTFERMAVRTLGVRFRGAGALDLCYVACGRLDGYWELDQSPWDIAAGALIVQEAGGRMSNFHGERFDIFAGQTVASNRRIHPAMVNVLRMPGSLPSRYRPPVRRV
jgi:myo-inositol-1(or 4)-monophosphatase